MKTLLKDIKPKPLTRQVRSPILTFEDYGYFGGDIYVCKNWVVDLFPDVAENEEACRIYLAPNPPKVVHAYKVEAVNLLGSRWPSMRLNGVGTIPMDIGLARWLGSWKTPYWGWMEVV